MAELKWSPIVRGKIIRHPKDMELAQRCVDMFETEYMYRICDITASMVFGIVVGAILSLMTL